MFWKPFTTAGAVASIVVGTTTALVLIYLSPTIQVDMLKHPAAMFPLRNPGIVSIPLSFVVGIVVSLMSPEAAAATKFAAAERQLHLGEEV